MTSYYSGGAARGRLVALVSAVAITAGIGWSAAAAAQPKPAAPPKPAAAASQPASKPISPSERQKRATEGATLRDYVVVKSSVDRSAIWIGDRFAFIVDVDCSHGTDILTDDLSRDRLKMDDLDILGVEESREDKGDGRIVYRFTYRLTTYSFEPASKRIGELRLRYYVRRPGQRPEEIEPAGEVTVPGLNVYVRSLLPDDANETRYRNQRSAVPRATVFALMGRLGIGVVIVSVVPAVLWLVALQRKWSHRRRRMSVRQLRHDERASLDDVRALDVESEAGRKDVYDRLCALLRTHVTGAWGVNAEGLTSAEIALALSAAGKTDVSAEATAFLDSCENARYGKPDGLPSSSVCRAAIDRTEQLIGLGRS
ncbi:MAG: hypothetical protein WCP29_16590 [Acidobacteriota bacterium]